MRRSRGLLERKTVKYKFKLTAVALANKLARIVYGARDQRGQLRRPSRRGLNRSSGGTSFRRKAIRIEGYGEAM